MLMDLHQISPKRILVINTFGIGDVLFTTPFISSLKLNFPDSFVGYVGNRRTATLLEQNPDINRVYVYERDEFKNIYHQSKWKFLDKFKQSLREIKEGKYDIVFDFSLNRTMNFLTKWIGIQHRVGLNYKGRMPYSTVKIPFDGFEHKHVAEYYLDILTSMGLQPADVGLKLGVSLKDQEWADCFLEEAGCHKHDEFIGIIPGAGESWGSQARFRRW